MENKSHSETNAGTAKPRSSGCPSSFTTAYLPSLSCMEGNPDGALTQSEPANLELGGDKPSPSSKEGRRLYQKAYYEAHKEEAKEYQRRYNAKKRKSRKAKKRGKKQSGYVAPRQGRKIAFTASDLMDLRDGRLVAAMSGILKGEKVYSRSWRSA